MCKPLTFTYGCAVFCGMCSSGICQVQHLPLLVCVRLYFPGAGTEVD